MRVKRVYNGSNSSIVDFPYAVSLEYNSKHSCGGSIISEHNVLTAAHCVKGYNPSSLKIRAGSSFRELGGSLYNVENYTSHPDYYRYKNINTGNDLAVLKLTTPIEFDRTKGKISLLESVEHGMNATIAGWGLLDDDKPNPDRLRSANLTVIDSRECRLMMSTSRFIIVEEGEICAVSSVAGACLEDSGGPLVVDGRLAGVITQGGCGNSFKHPTVATEVAYFRSWIDSTMRELNGD